MYVNAKPVIVDVEENSWCIDPKKIEQAITKNTKAIIPVHLYGQVCDMTAIMRIAKKYNLPDRIIDFIRTHHGTSSTYYFYKKEQELNPDTKIDIKRFQYQGPIPFSKETAILMMCDAAEAASKSIKSPTAQLINDLIDKIIDKQMADNQFLNSDITFREIKIIKKVIKKKLMNIYHLRVEYPE